MVLRDIVDASTNSSDLAGFGQAAQGLIHSGRVYQIFLDFSNGRTAQKRVNASRQPAIAIELR